MAVPDGKVSIVDLATQKAALAAQAPDPLVINAVNVGAVDFDGTVKVQFSSSSASDVRTLITWLQSLIPLLCLILISCGHESSPEAALGGLPVSYAAAADRALSMLDASGWVVTRHGDEEKHQGDSLIFTGILAASLDCARGEKVAAALLRQPPGLWRHPSLKDEPVSLDGALGFYLAAAYRIKKCGEKLAWQRFLTLHADAKPGPDVPAYFDYVRERLLEEAGVRDLAQKTPVLDRAQLADNRRKLELEVGGWALAVVTGKKACYRVHLGLLAFETLELLGDTVGGGEFCSATKNADLPTTDRWCGRSGLNDYVESYRENEWQYRHQRCPGWEDADGSGDEQPGVDYLRALQTLGFASASVTP